LTKLYVANYQFYFSSPWTECERVVRAGYLTGRRGGKAERLGLRLRPARRLKHTEVVEEAYVAFELVIVPKFEEPTDDHVSSVCDVGHVHQQRQPATGGPILCLDLRDFATLGER
jgi:hypothetical protein